MINFAESPENINLVSPQMENGIFLKVFFENPQLGKDYCNNKQYADEKTFYLLLLLNSNVCFGHVLGDYHFFGVEKFMRCEGELGTTYLKLEKKWFQNARIFQKEDGIWNELCLKDKKQGKNFKKTSL